MSLLNLDCWIKAKWGKETPYLDLIEANGDCSSWSKPFNDRIGDKVQEETCQEWRIPIKPYKDWAQRTYFTTHYTPFRTTKFLSQKLSIHQECQHTHNETEAVAVSHSPVSFIWLWFGQQGSMGCCSLSHLCSTPELSLLDSFLHCSGSHWKLLSVIWLSLAFLEPQVLHFLPIPSTNSRGSWTKLGRSRLFSSSAASMHKAETQV